MTTSAFSWKNPITSALLFLAVFFSAWLLVLSKHHKPITTQNDLVNQPDSFMEGVTATIMSKTGNPSLKIQSPKMIHYAENDTTDIVKPHVTIYRQSPEPWYVDSDRGKAINGIEHIIFSSNVVIHHPSDAANPVTIMKTATLDVFPDKKQATTADAVTITQPDTIVHAIGMLANLEDGTVQLLSNAKGDYVPTS